MANFKTPVTNDKGKVPCGTHLDRDMHHRIVDWCNARGIDLDAFLRVSAYHFYFALNAKGGTLKARFLDLLQTQEKHHHHWGGK
jgi:hypothetical protein